MSALYYTITADADKFCSYEFHLPVCPSYMGTNHKLSPSWKAVVRKCCAPMGPCNAPAVLIFACCLYSQLYIYSLFSNSGEVSPSCIYIYIYMPVDLHKKASPTLSPAIDTQDLAQNLHLQDIKGASRCTAHIAHLFQTVSTFIVILALR